MIVYVVVHNIGNEQIVYVFENEFEALKMANNHNKRGYGRSVVYPCSVKQNEK